MLCRATLFCSADPAFGRSGRAEFVNGEVHTVKEAAGVLFCGGTAFLIGDAEVVSVDYHLNSSHHSDNGEKAVGDVEGVAVIGIAKSAKPLAYSFGHGAYIAGTATAGLTRRHDLRGQEDRVESFYRCYGCIGLGRKDKVGVFLDVLGGEYLCGAFATVKDDLLVVDADTGYSGGTGDSRVNVYGNVNEKSDIYRIKASVKLQGLYVGIGVDYLGGNGPYALGRVQGLLIAG